jgi:two-component system response regulator PilR (NtrC family)
MGYHFPGNVRELENIFERALAVDEDGRLGLDDLPVLVSPATVSLASEALPSSLRDSAASFAQGERSNSRLPLSLPDHLQRLERAVNLQALEHAKFHRGRAAQLLGISLRQIRYRMQRLGIHED